MKTLYLCGAGNLEGIRLALTINQKEKRWDRIFLLDDNPAKHGQSILEVEVAGPFEMLQQAAPASAEVANLVTRTTAGRWSARRKILAYDLPFATLVSPDVDMSGVAFGKDIIVYQAAIVGPGVSMDEGSVIWMAAAVGHGSRLGPCCVVAPHAVVNARVQLGEGAYVGANATILPDVKVGPWATIAAGSVALRAVPAGATVMGVPGRVIWTHNPELKLRAFRSSAPGFVTK